VSDEPVERSIALMSGPAALPRKNGEIVFEAPWQGRAFGIGVALCQRGIYPWREFQERLIGEVGAADRAAPDAAGSYYEQWVAALEKLLVERKVLDGREIERRTREFLSGARDEMF
jgi:nitrile hydratase accessory protein